MRFQKQEEVWKRTDSGGLWIGRVISFEFIHPMFNKPWVVLDVGGCLAFSDVDSLHPMKDYGNGEEVRSEHSRYYSLARHTIEAA